ncbi:MAG: hypothetical protein ACF8OB_08165 [Phycisphaeraceae bacterium JB051]
MARYFTLLLAFVFLFGCETIPTRTQEAQQLQEQLRQINVNDGIDATEANIIAQSYFMQYGPGCGIAPPVEDDGEHWISKTVVGVVPVATAEPIRIDKATGAITWGRGLTVEDPKSIWK